MDTKKEQDNNKTNTRWVTFNNKKYSLTQIAKKLGTTSKRLDYHLHKGRDINHIFYFLTKKVVKNDKSKYIISYDPGHDGAIVVYRDGSLYSKGVVPQVSGKTLDLNLFIKFFSKFKDKDVVVVYEELHALFRVSASATFTLGYHMGVIKTMTQTLGMKSVAVKPKEWQKEMWGGFDKIMVKKKGNKKKTVDTKATSLKVCRSMFPSLDLRKNDRCTNPHDGIVDALLLAEYAKRKNL